MSVSGPGPRVKKLVQIFETTQTVKPKKTEAPKTGKTTNGRSVQLESSDSGKKTEELAKTILPNKGEPTSTLTDDFVPAYGNPELRKRFPPPPPAPVLQGSASFRERLPPAPPIPTAEDLAKLESQKNSVWKQSSRSEDAKQQPLAGQQRTVTSIWDKVQVRSDKSTISATTYRSQTPEGLQRGEANTKLAEQLLVFSAVLQKVKHKGSKDKITVTNDGQITLTKRKFFGVRFGRSEGTKRMISTLNEMKLAALNSKDPELLYQYIKTVQDLRSSSWGKKIVKNNDFKELINSSNTAIKGAVADAAAVIFSTQNPAKLMEAAKVLSMARNLNCFSPEQLAAIDDGMNKIDLGLLSRVDETTFKEHLLGQNAHTEGRTLLQKSAGEVVKAEEYIEPIRSALKEIKEMEPKQAEEALQSLLDFSLHLAALPAADLDAQTGGTSLRNELRLVMEHALDKALLSNVEEDPNIRQTRTALALLLDHQETDLTSRLDSFRTNLENNDMKEAAKELLDLSFLSHSRLESPLYPERPDSPSVRQEFMRVRDAVENDFGEQVAIFDLLLTANAEKAESVEIPSVQAQDFQTVQNGYTAIREGRDGAALREALVKDFRAHMGSIIKQTALSEFRNQNWSKPKTEANSPHILKFTSTFNRAHQEVLDSIWNSSNPDEVKNMINFWAETMDACLKDKNYAAAMAIYSALGSASVNRVVKIPGVLSPENAKRLENAKKILTEELSYKSYRENISKAMSDKQKPIPYLGVLLSDLLFSEEGNPDKRDGNINLIKAKLYSNNYKLFRDIRDNLQVVTERKTDFFSRDPQTEAGGSTQFDNNVWKKSNALFPKKPVAATI